MHQLAILFGFRPSIAHILRLATFPSEAPPPLEELADRMSREKTAPCYLILCDGSSSVVLEKDLLSAKIRTSDEFIVHTNNDTTPPNPVTKSTQSQKENEHSVSGLLDELGMEAFLKDSRERQACVQKKWDALKSRQRRKQQVQLVEESEMVGPSVREETLVGWVKNYPTMNDQSHFGCVMDPKRGEIRWLERGEYWDSGDETREDRMAVSDNE
jgi:hypothetical protein